MKTTTILVTVLIATTLPAQTRLANGLEFRTPAGWQVTNTEHGALLTPPHAVAGSEGYVVALLPGVTDLRDRGLLSKLAAQFSSGGVNATPLGAPAAFPSVSGTGFLHSYDFVENGRPGRLQFYVVGLPSGGAAAVVAAGAREVIPARADAVMTVAASLTQAAGNGSPLAQQWMQRLSGKKLMQFSSYSSGSSGGYSSERTLVLAADGSYAFRTSSSVSIYTSGATGSSAGRNGSGGQWRIYEQGGRAMLELQAQQAGREVIVLTAEGSKTLLNGRRWLVAPIQ